MPSFGTSEPLVFGVQGPVKLARETDEVCPTCEFSTGGPYKFKVYREDHRSVTLICPNCGETKTVFPADVIKPFGDAKPATVSISPKKADKAEVEPATATKPTRGRPKGSKNKPKLEPKAQAKTKTKTKTKTTKASSRA